MPQVRPLKKKEKKKKEYSQCLLYTRHLGIRGKGSEISRGKDRACNQRLQITGAPCLSNSSLDQDCESQEGAAKSRGAGRNPDLLERRPFISDGVLPPPGQGYRMRSETKPGIRTLTLTSWLSRLLCDLRQGT